MTIAALEALTFGLGRLNEAARNAGHRLCLLTGDRSVYRHELARLAPGEVDIVDVDTTDEAACAAALADLPDLRGLINSTDTWSVPGADLAAKLGLPGPDPNAVRLLRDKSRVRSLLHAHGLSRGRALAVAADDECAAAEILREIGLPAILKDSAGTSSRNVWPVRDEEQLHTALAQAAGRSFNGRLFAEPYFSGPVYSAETLSWEDDTKLLGVLSRQMSPEPSVREEAAAFPVGLPRPEHDLIEDWVGRVLKTAGHATGFAHVEFVLTTEGPELVEINRRIGGALVGEALCRALGTNVYDAMVDTALGRRPALLDTAATPGPATGFVLVYPDRPGTLTGWTGLDGLSAFPGSPEWYPTAAPGQRMEHLSDQRGCTGIVLTEAATAELALHRALSAAGSIRPVVAADPLGLFEQLAQARAALSDGFLLSAQVGVQLGESLDVRRRRR
ncbi:ATP-grasp domain-containing protein [Streptomyces sp. NBC_00648]|uniref:ATP-grasp domain-containing protein n=1 Tax=Streptomyces sp. NBC_00648 TaxID=2975797 RepID=UPI002F90679E